MKKTYLVALLSLLIFGILSCKKEKENGKLKKAPFLDVNILFKGAVQPKVGNVLSLNLYYGDVTGKSYQTLSPNEQIQVVLSDVDISQGLRLVFENIDRSADVAQVFAHVDVDNDGQISDGDLATFYNEKSLEDVESGDESPANLADKYAITFNVSRFIGEGTGETVDGKVTDFDGNEYETVTIGEQVWMKQNLKVTHYNNGDPIPTGLDNAAWAATTNGAYSVYDYNGVTGINSEQEMIDTYGLLYNWYAIDNQAGICPQGWRVATDDDWRKLELFIGMTETEIKTTNWRGTKGESLKSITGWEENNLSHGTDDYGFTALPGGQRSPAGAYGSIGVLGLFWTATPSTVTAGSGVRRGFRSTYNSIILQAIGNQSGHSVRLIKIRD